MSMIFQGMQTPTDIRVRKAVNGGFIVEMTIFDPHAEQSCQRHGIKGKVFEKLDDAMAEIYAYLRDGKGCLCEDCNHA